MSAEAAPITLTRFASALSELPIDAVYSKYAELRNNITHMEASNEQLEEFARENDDRDCYEALLENRQVIARFKKRIEALKREVAEVRGLPWRPAGEEVVKKETVVNGVVDGGRVAEQSNGTGAQGATEEDGLFL
jgi:hypothetical protein